MAWMRHDSGIACIHIYITIIKNMGKQITEIHWQIQHYQIKNTRKSCAHIPMYISSIFGKPCRMSYGPHSQLFVFAFRIKVVTCELFQDMPCSVSHTDRITTSHSHHRKYIKLSTSGNFYRQCMIAALIIFPEIKGYESTIYDHTVNNLIWYSSAINE